MAYSEVNNYICADCGREITDGEAYESVKDGRLLCQDCYNIEIEDEAVGGIFGAIEFLE